MFKRLKLKYEKPTVQFCDKLLHTQCRINKLLILNEFLNDCLIKFVCPKWMTARIYKSKLKYSYKVEKLFIKSEVSKNLDLINKLQNIMLLDLEKLRNLLDLVDFNNLEIYIQEVIKKQSLKIKIKNDNNLKRLVLNLVRLKNTKLLICRLILWKKKKLMHCPLVLIFLFLP